MALNANVDYFFLFSFILLNFTTPHGHRSVTFKFSNVLLIDVSKLRLLCLFKFIWQPCSLL